VLESGENKLELLLNVKIFLIKTDFPQIFQAKTIEKKIAKINFSFLKYRFCQQVIAQKKLKNGSTTATAASCTRISQVLHENLIDRRIFLHLFLFSGHLIASTLFKSREEL
jgi:uncharacterized membrane protein